MYLQMQLNNYIYAIFMIVNEFASMHEKLFDLEGKGWLLFSLNKKVVSSIG